MADGLFTISGGWQRIHGVDNDQLSFDELKNIAHPSDLPRIEKAFQDALIGEHEYNVTHRIVRRDTGEIRVVSSHSRVLRDDRGRPAKMYGVCEDITDQNLAIQEAQRSSERFRTAFNYSSVGMAITSMDGTFISVNEAAARILGYTVEECNRKSFADVTHPEDQQASIERFGELVGGKVDHYTIQKRYRRKNGETIWGILTVSMGRDQEGRPSFALAQLQDITRRVESEHALKREEAYHRLLFENMTQGVVYQQDDGSITHANRAALDMFGITLKQLQGRTSMHPEWRVINEEGDPLSGDAHPSMVAMRTGQAVRDTRDTIVAVFNPTRKDYVWLNVNALPVFREDDQSPAHVIITMQDITRSRRVEAELARADKLESVGLLAGGIAHDFNNFLLAIMGNISLVRMHLADQAPEILELLSQAEAASRRASNLTQQLLTFARGGAPVKRTIALKSVLKDWTTFALRGSPVRCRHDIDSDLMAVEADEGQLSQVIHNLIVNAAQAMTKGGDIHIKAANVFFSTTDVSPLRPGSYVTIEVSDLGVGIDDENLSKVFDPFFTTKPNGKGLGLASCYSIVHRHGGHIDVSTRQGSGSTFAVYLPATTQTVEQDDQREQALCRGEGRILIMDDDIAPRKLFRGLLINLGYEVTVSADGAEAIKLSRAAQADDEAFDLAILDLTVPGGMGGRECLQHILRLDLHARAIVSSGYSTDPVLAKPEDYGFAGRISKPFTSEELWRTIRDVMRR